MAKRGRKPHPAALDALRGHPGKRRRRPVDTAALPGGVPAAVSDKVASLAIPPPPAHLDALAKAEWRRLAEELVNQGLLRKLDLAAFEARCCVYSRWRGAVAKLSASGETYELNGIARLRPEARIAADCEKRLLAYDSEFGMTPAARARVVHVTGDPKQPPLPGMGAPAPAAASGQPPAAAPPRDIERISDDEFRRGPPH